MKKIEITTKLNESFDSASKKLEELGYKIIRKSEVNDIYLTQKLEELSLSNIRDILNSSVLIRNVKLENEEIKRITYKNKEYDECGDVISEQKIDLDINDIKKAEALFNCLNFKTLINVKYKVIVYEKEGIEFAFQSVDSLGTLIEYENNEDYTNKTVEDINIVKKQMYKEIQSTGVEVTEEIDVKKAYELIIKKYFNKQH